MRTKAGISGKLEPLSLVSLYHYRKAFGLTAEDVAKRSGLGLQTVYRVEKGKTDKIKSLSAYMRVFGAIVDVKIVPIAKRELATHTPPPSTIEQEEK
jgi:transcriptional regulator with XRE-family HTH domain